MKINLICLLLIFSTSMAAQGIINTPPKVVDRTLTNETYIAHADGWMVDINKAYQVSNKTGKPIMANFTGSDWCGWCKKLKYEVFDKKEFKSWAYKNVVLVELDFPRRFQIPQKYKEQNQGLAQFFKVTAYPTIWVFNLSQNDKGFTIDALGKTGYVKGVTAFTSGVDGMIKQYNDREK